MKKKYFVEFTKTIQYHVEAEDMDKAEQMALDIDADKDADIRWVLEPYERIIVEEE